MKLIERNPFRMLGIAINASAKDLAGNLGKKRLLDIGKEVVFPLDLPKLLPTIQRTAKAMDEANTAINLSQDKVRNALFWFAQPQDPMGKLAYDHLLQGNNDKSLESFVRSTSWESKLCLSVLHLQAMRYEEALSCITCVLNQHCADFCQIVAGQTYSIDSVELRHQYLTMLTEEVDAGTLLAATQNSLELADIVTELQDMALAAPIAAIENAIADAKSFDKHDAEAQLAAGQSLMNDTKKSLEELRKLTGSKDLRYSRLADKLAGQILQCSINYHNIIDESENRHITISVVEECLKLAEYALKVSTGKIAQERIKKNIEILHKKKEELPPSIVASENTALEKQLLLFAMGERTIDSSINFMKVCAPNIVKIKEKNEQINVKRYYIKISTMIVNAVLSCVIDEYNKLSRQISNSDDTNSDKFHRLKLLLEKAWTAFLMMDQFDKEPDFENGRYQENREAIIQIITNIGGKFCPSDLLVSANIRLIFKAKRSFYLPEDIDPDEFDLRTESEQYDDCKNAEDYEKYIQRYPKSEFRQDAQQKLEDCMADECLSANKCERYLQKYPNGRYYETVKKKLEDYIFEECKSINGCQRYLEKYSNGRYKKEVEKRLEKLEFDQCKTIDDYNAFQKKYPKSKYGQLANERIAEINQYNSCETVAELKAYIDQFPEGLFKGEAYRRIDILDYKACTTLKDYEEYLRKYPMGYHKADALKEIQKIKDNKEGNGCIIAIIAAIVICIVGVGIIVGANSDSFWPGFLGGVVIAIGVLLLSIIRFFKSL